MIRLLSASDDESNADATQKARAKALGIEELARRAQPIRVASFGIDE
jgi:hypothetical protein